MSSFLTVLETNLARELVTLIDSKLLPLNDEAGASDCADLLGYFDSLEHLTGLGFATCQNFITAIHGILRIPKNRALDIGPFHRSGRPVAAIVNSAANYWKHNYEWGMEKTPHK